VRRLFLLLVTSVLVTGCGSSPRQSQSTSRQGALLKGCPSLDERDIKLASGISPVHRRHLSNLQQTGLLCGSIFFGGSGDLIVEVTEASGGVPALRRLRTSSADQFGRAALRRLSGLGPGAFLARRRILAFARSGRVVTLETGYGSEGRLSLTVSQLTHLARLVAARS
jgi:hypothetical protein